MVGKKFVVLVLIAMLLATTAVFAEGVGIAAGIQPLGGLPGSNVMLSLRVPQIPFLMGVGFSIGTDTFSFGLTGDWWMAKGNLFSFVNYYLGPGFYVGYANALAIGGRLPIGLNMYPIKNLELFLEVAPTLAAVLSDPVSFPEFGLQGAFGLRFWF